MLDSEVCKLSGFVPCFRDTQELRCASHQQQHHSNSTLGRSMSVESLLAVIITRTQASKANTHLHALQPVYASDTVSHGQNSAQVCDRGLVLLLKLLDRGDQLGAHMLDQVFAAELGLESLRCELASPQGDGRDGPAKEMFGCRAPWHDAGMGTEGKGGVCMAMQCVPSLSAGKHTT
eukprot:scaffold50690_cov17-Tisochrysis_lutea.AAC.4